MAKTVKAITTGYDGVALRTAGEVLPWPEKTPLGKWVKPVNFGGKGDHDGDGTDGGTKAPNDATTTTAVVVPADWQNGTAADRKALAKQISGTNPPNAAEADKIIAAHVEANKPEAFGDAPPPQTVQQGLKDAGGGPAPDWVAPGVDASGNQQPVPADDE